MRHLALATFVIIASLGSPLLVSAQAGTVVTQGTESLGPVFTSPPTSSGSGQNVTLINPLKGADCSSGNGNCLESFLLNILAFIIRIGTIIVILMMVFVGYLFVAARGEPGKITEARNALLWTVVGALILLGSQAIAIGIKATVQALSVGQ